MHGEIRLVDYGIQNENSDWRVHVCFVEGAIYAYETQAGVEVCAARRHAVKSAGQEGVSGATALGFVVPPDDIPGCRRVEIPSEILARFACSSADTTSVKGAQAVKLVNAMLEDGLVPIPIRSQEVLERSQQIAGVDVVAGTSLRIQVKCDFRGGRRPKGTGNLYLQFAERNPNGQH